MPLVPGTAMSGVRPMNFRCPLPRTLYSSMWCASVGGGAAASTYRYLLSRLSASSVYANSPLRTGVLAKNFRLPLGAIP